MKYHVCEEDYVGKPSRCPCEINRYLKSIADDLVITCDKIIATSETVPINLNEKHATYEMKTFYILSAFLLITILLLIIASVYCFYYQKCTLPYQHSNNKLKEIDFNNTI